MIGARSAGATDQRADDRLNHQQHSKRRRALMATEKMGIALGMIETRGLVPAIEAADAMTGVTTGVAGAGEVAPFTKTPLV